MSDKKTLIEEIKQEMAGTRATLERVPFEKAGWAPHEKSMKIDKLAVHLPELVEWITMVIETDKLDFQTDYTPPTPVNSKEELLTRFDKNLAIALAAIESASPEKMKEDWTMRSGDIVYFTMAKDFVLRRWVLNHIIHHRAQLGVYLRLLGVPVPFLYGPTADDAQ